jgi:uncharacterized protein (TIRG00374 family)
MAALTRTGPVFLVGAVAVNVAAFLFTGTRWWLLLRYTGERAGWRDVMPSYYLGLFFNNLLPTGIGGDVVRTVRLNRRGIALPHLAASMIMDRAIGLLIMLLVATACTAWVTIIPVDQRVRDTASIVFVTCLALTAVAFSPWAGALLKRLEDYVRHTRVRRGILESIALCYSYRGNLTLMLVAAVLSVAAQSLAILSYILLGHSIGLELAPISYFVVVPVVFIAAMLPVSLGGLGVREGALVGLLMLFGADRQLAIGLSLLYLASLWFSTLPGAAVLLTRASPSTDHVAASTNGKER